MCLRFGEWKEMYFVYSQSSMHMFESNPVGIGLPYRVSEMHNICVAMENRLSVLFLSSSSRHTKQALKNKCVEILKNGWNVTDCCKKNKYFVCKRAKGDEFFWGHFPIKDVGAHRIFQGMEFVAWYHLRCLTLK